LFFCGGYDDLADFICVLVYQAGHAVVSSGKVRKSGVELVHGGFVKANDLPEYI